jgi:hypothetical protein
VPQRWQKGLPVSQPEACLQFAHFVYILLRQGWLNETKRNTSLRLFADNRRWPAAAMG